MRTLTQVWVFFIALTFLFILLGFQLAGRIGLLTAFLLSLFFIYATLQRGLRLFKNKLMASEFCGNDVSGLLNELNHRKSNFGFKKIVVYTTETPTPPLIWKNTSDEGHILINSKLPQSLSPVEIKLLSIFLLSHLENRSFIITPILSVINQTFFNLNIFTILISSIVTKIFRTSREILRADRKFKSVVDESEFEVGYFLNRMHHFSFNQNQKKQGTDYFSVLSIQKGNWLNQFGIPNLNIRLENIMGFTIN